MDKPEPGERERSFPAPTPDAAASDRWTLDDVETRRVLTDVSVVIPTLGRPILRRCLESIVRGGMWPARIIAVDQSASETVASWIAEVRAVGVDAEHVPSRQRGRSLGVNRGIERVTTRFVAITDDDCVVDSDWLATLEAALLEDSESVVTGRVEAAGEEQVAMVVSSLEPTVRRRPSLKFDPLSGGNMALALAVFDRVGPLDEHPSVQCAEDGEWAYRALRAGVPIRYIPAAAVHHFGWRSREERVVQYRTYARSQGGFYGKYLRRGDGFIALRAALHHLRALRRWLRGVVQGDDELAMIGRAYFTGLLPGIRAGFRRGAKS